MKKIFTLICFASLFNIAIAQQPDAEYNLIRKTYTLNADGSMDYQFHKELTLHANRAMTAYATNGETFITYNPTQETLTINSCYFIRPDGTVVTTPQNAFVTQLPSECANCAPYNHYRELAIVHTGLELEGTIVLDYTIHHNKGGISQQITLAEDYPVQRYEIIINAAPGQQYFVQPENLNLVQYTTSGNGGQYTLSAYNLQKRYTDPYLPSNSILYPNLYISTYTSQELDKLTTINIPQLPQASSLVALLRRSTPAETITEIRNWVLNNVTTADIKVLPSEISTNNIARTYATNCGTPADKVLLLASLLRTANFDITINWNPQYLQNYMSQQYALFDATNAEVIIRGEENLIINPFSTSNIRTAGTTPQSNNIVCQKELPWKCDTLTGHYVTFTLPVEDNAFQINPAYITPYRVAPLQVKTTNERYHYTIQLPQGAKVIKPGKQTYNIPNVGQMSCTIKQDKQTLDIERQLVISQDIINADNINLFHKMMLQWFTTQKIQIKL